MTDLSFPFLSCSLLVYLLVIRAEG